jgi:N-acetylmuramoyl-L-alanine amidase
MKIVISSGHGKYVRGASGYIDEVDEARRVVERVAEYLRHGGMLVQTFHDDVSHSQSENLNRIVSYHNAQSRELDVSVHFNAYNTTSKPMGCEVLYVTQHDLAADTSEAIADAGGFINRGAKKRTDLAFLNGTEEPAILIETCFVDSSADVALYEGDFDAICLAIAEAISGAEIGEPIEPEPPEPEEPPPLTEGNRVDIVGDVTGDVAVTINGTLVRTGGSEHKVDLTITMQGDVMLTIQGEEFHNKPPEPLLHVSGKCSWFGGPNDTGVSPSEGLAFIYNYNEAPHLFLPQQPPNTTGLARRLNADAVYYVACRWDYDVTPKDMLADKSLQAIVRANGREFLAWPADWGPNENTGRVADISPALMAALGIETDDVVEVTYPATVPTV